MKVYAICNAAFENLSAKSISFNFDRISFNRFNRFLYFDGFLNFDRFSWFDKVLVIPNKSQRGNKTCHGKHPLHKH